MSTITRLRHRLTEHQFNHEAAVATGRPLSEQEHKAAQDDLVRYQFETERSDRRSMALASGMPSAFDDTLRFLDFKGWEVHGGMLQAYDTKTNKLVPFCSVKTFIEDAPRDRPDQVEHQRLLRHSASPLYRKVFERWLSNCARYGSDTKAIAHLANYEQKALSEGMDSAGGAMVPLDYAGDITSRIAQRSIYRRFANVRTTTSDNYVLRRFVENTSSGSLFTSGFVGGWVGETVPAQSETSGTFGAITIPIRKARSWSLISKDLAADVPELMSWLTNDGGDNLSVVEDQAYTSLSSTGNVALQPFPLLGDSLGTVDVTGSTAHTISNSTTAPGSLPKMIQLQLALPDQYHKSPASPSTTAIWMMRIGSENSIRQLVDAQARPAFSLDPQLSSEPLPGYRLLFGYPVVTNASMDADGTAGSPIFFGSLSDCYLVVTRSLLTVRVVTETSADTEQLRFILFDRVGGGVMNPDAGRLGTLT